MLLRAVVFIAFADAAASAAAFPDVAGAIVAAPAVIGAACCAVLCYTFAEHQTCLVACNITWHCFLLGSD